MKWQSETGISHIKVNWELPLLHLERTVQLNWIVLNKFILIQHKCSYLNTTFHTSGGLHLTEIPWIGSIYSDLCSIESTMISPTSITINFLKITLYKVNFRATKLPRINVNSQIPHGEKRVASQFQTWSTHKSSVFIHILEFTFSNASVLIIRDRRANMN